jgi:beta-lactam-binding protein with PASTA domain
MNIIRKYFFKKLSLLWILPFLAFLFGYVLSSYLLQKRELQVPHIIGKTLAEGVQILSEHRLGLRLLVKHEDASLPEGIILDQLPRPLQKIRSNQAVLVTLSTRKKILLMEDFYGKKRKDCLEYAEKKGIELSIVDLHDRHCKNICIAQIPSLGQELLTKKITLFFSAGPKKIMTMPLLKGFCVKELDSILQERDVSTEIIHTTPVASSHACDNCVIIEQQPFAGALVDLSKPLKFQIYVHT